MDAVNIVYYFLPLVILGLAYYIIDELKPVPPNIKKTVFIICCIAAGLYLVYGLTQIKDTFFFIDTASTFQ